VSVDDEEDEEDEVVKEEEEDDDEELGNVQTPQGLRCSMAPTLPRFITHSRSNARYVGNT